MKGNAWVIIIGMFLLIMFGLFLQNDQDKRLLEYVDGVVTDQQSVKDANIGGILRNYNWDNCDYIAARLNQFIFCDRDYRAIAESNNVFILVKGNKYKLNVNGLRLEEE